MMAGLKGDVKLPGVGSVPKWGVAGGAAVGVVIIIMYTRNKKSAASSAPAGAVAATGTDPYPPDGTSGNPNDLYSTDPATGQTYGDEQYAASQSVSGYASGSGAGGTGISDLYPWDGTVGNASDPYSMDPSTGQTYGDQGSVGSVSGTVNGGPPFTSNSSWSQYAENYLTGTVGEDPGTVATALGAYLEGQPVTTSQEDVINQAIAFAGNPPVAGAGGDPPGIKVQGSKQGGGGGQAKVPDVTGERRETAEAALQAAGFRYQTIPAKTRPGDAYEVTSQKPRGGSRASKGTLVSLSIKAIAAKTNPLPKVS